MRKIRLINEDEFDAHAHIYRNARKRMIREGNLSQWEDIEAIIDRAKRDAMNHHLYGIEDDNVIIGLFALSYDEDPTYKVILGRWLNQEPYAVIHRIARIDDAKGVLRDAVKYALMKTNNIRIDTHKANVSMRSALEKLGFIFTGVIFLENGEERFAYQLIRKNQANPV